MAPMVPTMKYEKSWFLPKLFLLTYLPKFGTFFCWSLKNGLSYDEPWAAPPSRAADVPRARVVHWAEAEAAAVRASVRDAVVSGAMTDGSCGRGRRGASGYRLGGSIGRLDVDEEDKFAD